MERFDPEIHVPATEEDSAKIEQALWEGWELMIEDSNGNIWIGAGEELIGSVATY